MIKKLSPICLIFVLGLFSFKTIRVFPTAEIPHQVNVYHPGISLTDKVTQTLVEIKNEKGQSEAFYMDVETVVCGDAQCKIDIIRIYWDELGFYSHLVLPTSVELEKSEGKYFDRADYDKLNSILANKNCSLKDVYKEEVVGSETTEGIDAISGATIILNTNDYVAGAVWTCYTLWHWVNGEISSIIRNITSDNLTKDDLVVLFQKEAAKEKMFALEQMTRRALYQPKIVQLVIENAPSNNYELTKLTINYFENTSPDIYATSLENLLKNGDINQRRQYLNAFSKTQKSMPNSFWESISSLVSTWADYPSVNQLLNGSTEIR